MSGQTEQDAALLALLSFLRDEGYRFITPTPETHRRVIGHEGMETARDLRGIFGWSLPFEGAILPSGLHDALSGSGLLGPADGLLKAKVRVSGVHDQLFIHSPYPTSEEDSVFLGPDSYRFVDFIRTELARVPNLRRLVDIGAGAGVGGLMAAAVAPGARLTLTDINPLALRYAAINARHAGVNVEIVEGSGMEAVQGPVDVAIANPPYIIDQCSRTYRDGGDMHGARISLEWTLAAARRVEPGGRVLLYTGSAIVAGRDALREALERELPGLGATLRYREIDPDVFGEELDQPGYEAVERIAAVGAVIEKA